MSSDTGRTYAIVHGIEQSKKKKTRTDKQSMYLGLQTVAPTHGRLHAWSLTRIVARYAFLEIETIERRTGNPDHLGFPWNTQCSPLLLFYEVFQGALIHIPKIGLIFEYSPCIMKVGCGDP